MKKNKNGTDMSENIGLLYNKIYFQDLKIDSKGNPKELGETGSSTMGTILNIDKENFKDLLKETSSYSRTKIFAPFQVIEFELRTLYPGLLCGSGYQHEIGGKDLKNEFPLGLYFDHTTGLPSIPGSSIKGVLRAACEMRNGEYLKELGEDEKDTPDPFDPQTFIEAVFDGKGRSIYQRDIFLDAFPVKCSNNLLGNDFITPHESPIQEPNPIQFLRVQPGVTYRFQFILKDGKEASANFKRNIFKKIILELGLGAKTNVGYGQFEEPRK